MTFPSVDVAGYAISRLVIGSNPFHGFSHMSAARDRWLRRHFTPERVFEVVAACARQGLNATVSMPRPDYAEVLRAVEAETGVHVHWFATPGGRDTAELRDGIAHAAELGAEFCLPHMMWTDARLLPARGIIEEAEEVLAFIRARGMVPGWSTHRPETVVVSDKAGYDVEVYIQICNSAGFLCQVETDWVQRVIRQTSRTVLCIKPLAAGRLLPPTGLGFVYATIKPNDIVALGMLSPEEAEEDVRIARELLEEGAAEPELQTTRSKAVLQDAS